MNIMLLIVVLLVIVLFALVAGLIVYLLSQEDEELILAPREEHMVTKLEEAGVEHFNRGLMQFNHQGRTFRLRMWTLGGAPTIKFTTTVKNPRLVSLAVAGADQFSPRLPDVVAAKKKLPFNEPAIRQNFYVSGTSYEAAQQVLSPKGRVREVLMMLRHQIKEVWFNVEQDEISVTLAVPDYAERDVTAQQVLLALELASRLADAIEFVGVGSGRSARSLRGKPA